MIAATTFLIIGLAAPAALRAWGIGRSRPRLGIAVHLAALLLTWAALLAVVGGVITDERTWWRVCQPFLARLEWQWSSHTGRSVAAVVVFGVITIRGVAAAATWAWRSATVRRRALASGARNGSFVGVRALGTLAATVGVVRPVVVVDTQRFERLTHRQQEVVLAHERGHARGRHAVIQLASRALTAGLPPWSGGVAHAEIRRSMEALADDHVARRFGRAATARALACVAASPAPRSQILGAAGWPVWRVQRLLLPPVTSPLPSALAAVAVLTTGIAVMQVAVHAVAGWHLPLIAALCL